MGFDGFQLDLDNEGPLPRYVHIRTGIGFALLPAGSFMLGTQEPDATTAAVLSEGETDFRCEQPVASVNTRPFLLGVHQVTQETWERVMDSPSPSYFHGPQLPVDSVSWKDAAEFCLRTGLSLPSEAQWEYACRAGSTTLYPWGESWEDGRANTARTWQPSLSSHHEWKTDFASSWESLGASTMEVGSFPPNKFGLHDMIGNVWEWCSDHWMDRLDSTPRDGAPLELSPDPGTRARRGGGFCCLPADCRPAARYGNGLGFKVNGLGFRVCYNPPLAA